MPITSVIAMLALGAGQATSGQALVDQSAAKLRTVRSISLTMTIGGMGQSQVMQTKMMRGGYVRATSKDTVMIATPNGGWMLMPSTKQYVKQPAAEASNAAREALPGFESLFPGSKTPKAIGAPQSSKLSGKSTLKVEVTGPAGANAKQYLHFDPATKMPAGVEMSMSGQTFSMAYSDVRLDPAFSAKDFAWSPPSDWKTFTAPATQDFTADLLKIGAKAPAFTLSSPKGGKTSFAQSMGTKATLVNFWFYG